MDNISHNGRPEPAFPNDKNLAITLSPHQYSFYRKAQLEIKCPEGNHLDYIGHMVQQAKVENDAFRLREQISLIACLLSNLESGINFPPLAAMGLAELLYRVQETKNWP